MATIEIADMMRILRIERAHTGKELKKMDKVISALRELSSENSTTRNGRRRRMSASARRKIAAAQRKRWAKFHKQRA
jgi:hypothetical protein